MDVPYQRQAKTAEWQLSVAEAQIHLQVVIDDVEATPGVPTQPRVVSNDQPRVEEGSS